MKLPLSTISKLTGIKHGTLRMRIWKGKLKATKIGRDWFVDMRDIKKGHHEKEISR